jgi:DNA-binding CsgD family transcriptional regulator
MQGVARGGNSTPVRLDRTTVNHSIDTLSRSRYRPNMEQLTPEEAAVYAYYADGFIASAIAARLDLAPDVVRRDIRIIHKKLGATSQAEIAEGFSWADKDDGPGRKSALVRKDKIRRYRCYAIYRAALKVGYLVRQPCEVCHSDNAEGHHHDYDKPLEVQWLCSTHHIALHKDLRRQAGAEATTRKRG